MNDLKSLGESKIHLTIAINFVLSKYTNETRTMYSKSSIIEVMTGNETNETIQYFSERYPKWCQTALDNSTRGGKFAFESVDLLCYKCYKTSLNRGVLYKDSSKWLKSKKPTANPKNYNNFFPYAITVA